MSADREWTEGLPRPCCVHLRAKSMFYRPDERPGMLHDEEAMGYWCLHSNDAIGPDGKAATHRLCQGGRQCFEPGYRSPEPVDE